MVGKNLGHYEILEPLGAGGMGEVYLGEDTRLNRKVAIKVLPTESANDPERLARFEQEARAAAALNHPHIAVVYDVGREDETHFIVQEYLAGESLRERLEKGALSLDLALELAIEVGEALVAAHKAGIIHRDLKPDNIFVTEAGHAKVLDFGLAKLTEQGDPAGAGLSMSPTMLGTVAGQVMGTAGYMSPEQAAGSTDIDQRADLFSFGCVLHEMVSGSRPFSGRSVAETLSLIQHERAPLLTDIRPGLPEELGRIVSKCLAKDPSRRYQGAADLVVDILHLRGDLESAASSPQRGAGSRAGAEPERRFSFGNVAAVGILAVAIGTVLGVLFGGGFFARTPPGPSSGDDATSAVTRRLSIALPETAAMSTGPDLLGSVGRVFDLSPDGDALVYTAASGRSTTLRYRRMDAYESEPIDGTEGGYHPFFSPDGESVGFVRGDTIMKVRLSGGAPSPVGTARQVQGVAWSDDGWIYVLESEGTRISRIPEDGGPAEVVFDFGSRRSELPDGERQPFVGAATIQALPEGGGLLLSLVGPSINNDTSWIVRYLPREDRLQALPGRGYEPRYTPDGILLYVRGDTLFAMAVDPASLEAENAEVPLLEGVRAHSGSGFADFDVSTTGDTLVYAAGTDRGVGVPTWTSLVRESEETPVPGLPARQYGTFEVSPDGERISIVVAEANDSLYLYDAARQAFERMPTDGIVGSSAWAPEGDWLAYVTYREGVSRLYRKWIDGRADELLLESEGQLNPEGFSPDGQVLALSSWPSGGLSMLDLSEPRGEPSVYLNEEGGTEWGTRFSPVSGRWVAYTSDERGTYDVYVREYPYSDRLWRISTSGGEEPTWAPDESRIYYRWGAEWFAVDVTTEPEFSAGTPYVLFRTPYLNVPGISYSIDPAGEELLMLRSVAEVQPVMELRVLLGWNGELRGRVRDGGR